MSADLSLIHLVAQASLLVKGVMLVLLLASVASWYIIVLKRDLLRHTRADADWFEEQFWSGGNLAAVYQAVVSRENSDAGLQGLFPAAAATYRGQPRRCAGLRAARHARLAGAGGRPAGGRPGGTGNHWLHQPLYRPVRHGVGHHECLHRPR
jgi:hypothetical protein